METFCHRRLGKENIIIMMKEKWKHLVRRLRLLWKRLPWDRLEPLKKYNPFQYIKRMDWYIIKKFIGTYIYSIILIISISIVFDVNENLAKFTTYHAPLRAYRFRLLHEFRPLFCQPVLPTFRFYRGHLLYLQTCRQFRDHRYACLRYEFQETFTPLSDFRSVDCCLELLSGSVCHTQRDRRQT